MFEDNTIKYNSTLGLFHTIEFQPHKKLIFKLYKIV